MAGVGIARPAFWGLATLSLLVFCLLPVLYTTTSERQRGTFRQHPRRWPFPREQRRDATIHVVPIPNQGLAHQNPARAPPQPLLSPALAASSPAELSDLSGRSSFLATRHAHHNISLAKRDGPLRCNDGPCIDGSCCSKDHICGFGPDFCGDGCLSQCDATAMCGEYSENGDMPCGLKLCCSAMGWCGTTTEFCHNADPLRGTLPCQAGYGSCYISGAPSCPYGGGSTNGRMVGYYQSWNMRNRVCNKVAPRDLNTTGYTHLFYSFASIDPATYRIAPAHADDPAMMREFTSLAKDGLQTWIAIGGFDFSDPGTPTHTTWSDVCATKARRAAFIDSVREYMDEYGFQGVDLDWEYPGDPSRGGNGLDDTKNLVLLVKEMRVAYGNAYGISLTLAPDYWYLRWFDPKGMEPYVDFFGFMAYDLHGSWDSDVLTLGKKVRGQADIREIANNTVPLWFDGLDPAKINFGLAMYGRGYTLADPSCNQLLCPFSGASDPAPCTNSDGVMSLLEIQQLIKRKGLKPQYLADSMMKQITWDDQWIGYDDEETFAAKKAWADSRCFGGTMVWSIDFQVVGSGNSDDETYGDVVYVGPEVFQKPTAQCSAPCVMVFPPSSLSEPKAITIPPYTATLEVGTTTTIVVVIPTKVTTTITVIDFFNEYVTSEQQPGAVFTLRPSFQPPPATVVVTGEEGRTTTRTVLPPPLGSGVASGPAQNQTGGVPLTSIPPPATD
ncbi:glycoside hydrolase family 18 protein, partial [Parathielavia appendiculata]